MLFPDPLRRGRLVRRYKRFLADVEWIDTVGDEEPAVTAHCANPGSMMGLADPGCEVWLSPARNPERKQQNPLFFVPRCLCVRSLRDVGGTTVPRRYRYLRALRGFA